MSGKKQHYVPHFLQAGFRSRPNAADDAPRAWLYRRGAAPADAALSDVGHEAWFYTFRRGGESVECADGAISEAERAWMSGLIRQLREDASLDLVRRHADIAHLMSHLVVRNRAIWKFIEAPAAPLFDKLREAARDRAWLAAALKRLLAEHRGFFEEALSAIFPGADIPSLLAQAETALATGVAPTPPEGAVAVLSHLQDAIAPRVLKVFRVHTLVEGLSNPSEYKLFTGCSFKVVRNTEGRLIQGDTPVVFHRADGLGFTPLPCEGEDFDYAYLPLSPSVVLIASKGGEPESWDALRRASAACSHTYFIAAERHPDLAELADSIASRFPAPSSQQLDRMFTDVMEEARSLDLDDPDLRRAIEAILADSPKSTPPRLTKA